MNLRTTNFVDISDKISFDTIWIFQSPNEDLFYIMGCVDGCETIDEYFFDMPNRQSKRVQYSNGRSLPDPIAWVSHSELLVFGAWESDFFITYGNGQLGKSFPNIRLSGNVLSRKIEEEVIESNERIVINPNAEIRTSKLNRDKISMLLPFCVVDALYKCYPNKIANINTIMSISELRNISEAADEHGWSKQGYYFDINTGKFNIVSH